MLTSMVLTVGPKGNVMPHPSPADLGVSISTHVFAFTSKKDLLVVESEGALDWTTWERVAETAKRLCCGEARADGIKTQGQARDEELGLDGQLRNLVRADIALQES